MGSILFRDRVLSPILIVFAATSIMILGIGLARSAALRRAFAQPPGAPAPREASRSPATHDTAFWIAWPVLLIVCLASGSAAAFLTALTEVDLWLLVLVGLRMRWALSSPGWTPTALTRIESSLSTYDGSLDLDVKYVYSHGGRSYVGTTVRHPFWFVSNAVKRRLDAEIEAGAVRTCFVDSSSTLTRA